MSILKSNKDRGPAGAGGPNTFPTKRRGVILACMAMLYASGLMAGETLDDSLSPNRQQVFRFRWAHRKNPFSVKSRARLRKQIGTVPDVIVRLDTAKYVGESARIYLTMPHQINGYKGGAGFEMKWTTGGVFLPGRVTPGSRTLLYRGVIDRPVLEGLLSVTITADAEFVTGKLRYETGFEIETD